MGKTNKSNVELTWKTIPGNKSGIKINIPNGVSKINKRPFEELPDSDSSSESLPENVLANFKSNVLSSDNDTDIEHNETGKSLLDETEEAASVKSEPLSEDEECDRDDSQDTSDLQNEISSKSTTRKDKQRLSDSHKKKKPLIKPCTTEEYNEFLRIERSRNDSSLKLGSIGNESTDDEINHGHSKSKKDKSPEKQMKKKKKKKKHDSDSEKQYEKFNNSVTNVHSQESDSDDEFEKPAKSKLKNKTTSSINFTSHRTKTISESYDETPKLKKKKKSLENDLDDGSPTKKSLNNGSVSSDNEIFNTIEIPKKKKRHSQSSDKLERFNSSKVHELKNMDNDSSGSETTYVDKSHKHKTSILKHNDSEKTNVSKEEKKKRKSLNKSVEFADGTKDLKHSLNNSMINDIDYALETPKKENRHSISSDKSHKSMSDHQQKILDLNNTNNSTDSDESSGNELDTTSHSFTYTSTQKEVKAHKKLNLSNHQDIESNESDDEASDINEKYSFQFNRSYESNKEHDKLIKSKTSSLNKSAEGIKMSPGKNEIVSNLSSKKIKKSVHSVKNFANSTALDMSNIEFPDMSLGNVSNIKDTDKPAKIKTHDLTSPTKGQYENNIVTDYLAKNENLQLKNFISNLGFDKIGDDDEVFLVQCPKNIDPNLLVDQNIFDSSFQYDGTDYKFSTIKSQNAQNISVFVPTKRSGIVKTLPLAGHVIIQTDLKPAYIKKVKKLKRTVVEFPDNLKVRHPIFGKHYKKKINIPEHILQELKSKKHKKPKKHKKQSRLSLQDESDMTGSVEISTKKRKRHSITEECEAPKKKKKKGIKQEDELWASNDDIARNLFN